MLEKKITCLHFYKTFYDNLLQEKEAAVSGPFIHFRLLAYLPCMLISQTSIAVIILCILFKTNFFLSKYTVLSLQNHLQNFLQ